MEMPVWELIWVNVDGGVLGFTPESIFEMERAYEPLKKYGASYWEYFEYYFRDILEGKGTSGFSALWHFDQAWDRLQRLRNEF